jgi:molybdopterin converting factor small subunit
MAVKLLIPTALRAFTDRNKSVSVTGATIGEAIKDLTVQYPAIAKHIYEENNTDLRSFINVFVGDTNIKSTGGLGTPVKDGETVTLVPAIAGGA